MEFRIGDVVQLKSGGPEMTIEEIGEHRLSGGKSVAFCVWFEVVAKQRVVKRETFRPEVLEAVEASESVTMRPSYF